MSEGAVPVTFPAFAVAFGRMGETEAFVLSPDLLVLDVLGSTLAFVATVAGAVTVG